MDRHTIIFTSDKRLEALGSLLPGRRIHCTWEEYRKRFGNSRMIRNIEYIYVLPIPVRRLDGKIAVKEQLQEDMSRQRIRCVFGGQMDETWCSFLNERNISYVDFMKLESVHEENGIITAEAVLAEVLQLSPFSIQGQKIMVTGFGVCAKAIANKLKVLGAHVIIVARTEHARKEAASFGYTVSDFTDMHKATKGVTTLINTVPSLVVTADVIRSLSKDAVILDIASKPGGTDFAVAQQEQIPAKLALGLPGIYSVNSSATLLRKSMWEYVPLPELKRGEQSWIFQIII